MQTKELLSDLRHTEGRNELVSILEKRPVSTLELRKKRPKAVLTGSFIGYSDLSTISKSQKELEIKLKIEAERLFRKKYPYRAIIYC